MLVWELPIPEFDPENALHREIAALGAECERTAAGVVLPEGDPPRKRRAIREALADAGLTARAEALVARVVGGRGGQTAGRGVDPKRRGPAPGRPSRAKPRKSQARSR